MKLGGIISTIFVIAMLSFASFTLYTNVPGNPIRLEEEYEIPHEVAIIKYGTTPVFAEKLRFNHQNISYSISSDCNKKRISSMLEAFEIFEKEMQVIKFYENVNSPDIIVQCSDEKIQTSKNLFIAGEGGPSRIVNTSNFKTIKQGTILLYKDETCDYPIVALHELLHVFGFDHTENKASIMHNVSDCRQRITPDMIETINELYSIEALPELRIKNLSAIKKGKYLDFNITIINEGLKDASDLNLTILSQNKIIQTINIGEIQIGYGRTLSASNVKLPLTKTEEITFAIDYENKIKEMIEANNIKKLKI